MFGDSVAWNFGSGVLTAGGSGAVPVFYTASPPGYPYRDYIDTVVIGERITGIGYYAFADCINLTRENNLNPVPQSITGNVFSHIALSDVELRVPSGSESIYGTSAVWKEFKIVELPSDITPAGTRTTVRVYTATGRLHVDTPVAERVNVYSVAGALLYGFDKPAGAFTFRTFAHSRLHPSPVLIVKGSSGWTYKIINYELVVMHQLKK